MVAREAIAAEQDVRTGLASLALAGAGYQD
jgi:hypothetical protein